MYNIYYKTQLPMTMESTKVIESAVALWWKNSYSSQVADEICDSTVGIVHTNSNQETIRQLRHYDIWVVPIYNKNSDQDWWIVVGNFAKIFEKLDYRTIKVVSFFEKTIKHVLAWQPDAKIADITDIHSHKQALKQCKEKLSELKASLHEEGSTTQKAENNTLKIHEAIICNKEAAEELWLKILHDNIGPDKNTTTFAIFTGKKGTDELLKELNNTHQSKMMCVLKYPDLVDNIPDDVKEKFDDAWLTIAYTEVLSKDDWYTQIWIIAENLEHEPKRMNWAIRKKKEFITSVRNLNKSLQFTVL